MKRNWKSRTQVAKESGFLIIAVVGVLLLGGGGAGAFFMLNPKEAGEEMAEEGLVEEEETEAPATPYYFSLNPPFVVNFVGKGKARFLQVNIDGLTRDPSVKRKHHDASTTNTQQRGIHP